jgi:hypothetical protein
MTAIRLSPTISRTELFTDEYGQSRTTIEYRVPGVSYTSIPRRGGAFGIPQINVDDHPDIGGQGLLARNLTALDFGNGIDAKVIVEYGTPSGNFGQTAGGTLVDLQDGTFAWSMSRQEVSVEIPLQIARKKIHTTRDAQGEPSVISSNYFEIQKRTIVEKRTVIQCRWDLDNPDGSDIQAFANQDGKIHLLNSGYYLFSVGTLQPKLAKPEEFRRRYTFVGSWIHDIGTPDAFSADTERLAFPSDLPQAFGIDYAGVAKVDGFMRLPWHTLDTVNTPAGSGTGGNSQGSPIDPYTIYQAPEYPFDLQGYTTLPGIPNSFPSGTR